MSASPMRFGALRSLGSVRVRSAIVSMLIVGTTFALSAFGVISILRDSLYSSATNSARADALDVSSFIMTRGRVPRHLPISADDMAAQVVDKSGNVVTSSRNVAGQPAMADLSPAPGRESTRSGVVLEVRRFTHVNLNLDSRFVVAAVGLKSRGFIGSVLVADSLGAADHAVTLVALSLAIALPILTLLVGILVWTLAGWALRPVEVIRSEVAKFSVTDLRRRIPELRVKDEIGRLAETMNAMLGRLEAANDRQRELVADVSHELRNPLASLRAQLEVAAAHPGPGSLRLVEGSIVEVNRMSQLVEDLLTLARLDEGILRLRPSDVDLDDLALTHAARLRDRDKVEVSVEGVSAARIYGDEAQLTRVVANLADNAERFALHRVTFTITEGEGSFDLIITDDGPGVPPEERQRVFERFVRLDTARTHQETGAGLGLAIVREIVLAHGGKVWIEDAAPGARFVVRLPRQISPRGQSCRTTRVAQSTDPCAFTRPDILVPQRNLTCAL